MALLVLLVPGDEPGRLLGSETLEALGRLGVTSVSLARDDDTTAIVLEGWAFDPSQPAQALAAIGAGARTRMLQPVVHMAVTAAARKGGAST